VSFPERNYKFWGGGRVQSPDPNLASDFASDISGSPIGMGDPPNPPHYSCSQCRDPVSPTFSPGLYAATYHCRIVHANECRRNCWLGSRRKSVGEIFLSGKRL